MLSLKRISLARLDRAFQRARRELREVGLLEDGRYLDRIDCYLTRVPTLGDELGYVYDAGVPFLPKLVGFRPGVIYVPINAPDRAYVPGGTLLDTIRHEYAHAWAWLDPRFLGGAWFGAAFGAPYQSRWRWTPDEDPTEFISDYARTSPAEDCAETFMTFLRYQRSLDRFRPRRGVYRKLVAVERAIVRAAKERVPKVRGPRER
ncbi:MAG: hypothetical protein OHK0013_01910 [Sandaracinaceae bacterium]